MKSDTTKQPLEDSFSIGDKVKTKHDTIGEITAIYEGTKHPYVVQINKDGMPHSSDYAAKDLTLIVDSKEGLHTQGEDFDKREKPKYCYAVDTNQGSENCVFPACHCVDCTPLPWGNIKESFKNDYGKWQMPIGRTSPHFEINYPIIVANVFGENKHKCEANAELIVKAVNERKALLDCIQAIGARLDGMWDNEQLKAVGNLHSNLSDDISAIIKFYQNKI